MTKGVFMVMMIVITALSLQVNGYPSGAGIAPGTCGSMTPGHYGSSTQVSASPYKVTVSSNAIAPGGALTVKLSGSANFKGFMLQARVSGKDAPVGTFAPNVPSGTQRQQCTSANDMVSHSDRNGKNDITVTWQSSADLKGSNVTFFATFVQSLKTYWVKEQSTSVFLDSAIPLPTPDPNSKTSKSPPSGNTATTRTPTMTHLLMCLVLFAMLF